MFKKIYSKKKMCSNLSTLKISKKKTGGKHYEKEFNNKELFGDYVYGR